MITLKESILGSTANHISGVKSQLNAIGYNFVISDFNMDLRGVTTFEQYFNADKLTQATKHMDTISPTLEAMLSKGYAIRMSKYGQAWENIVNMWKWIDNFEWSAQKVNWDTCEKLVNKMNEKLKEEDIFGGKLEFKMSGYLTKGKVNIALAKITDRPYITYKDKLLEFSIRRKR